MKTYAFLDMAMAIVGPGGNLNIGAGAGHTEEGFSVEYDGDKGTMQIGADGRAMHTLRARMSGTVTLRLQQNSETNARLNALFNYQAGSSANWGQNTISITNTFTGESYQATECAFRKHANGSFAAEGGYREWVFICGYIDPRLGDGDPAF